MKSRGSINVYMLKFCLHFCVGRNATGLIWTHPITRSQKPVADTTTYKQIHIPSNRGELSRICRIFGAGGSLDDEIKHLDRLFSECVASKPRHKDLELSPDEAPRPQDATSSS
jgi:hypothetical protein